MNELNIDLIMEMINHPEEEVRRNAILQLSTLPVEVAKEGILSALGDTSWRVRKTAIDAILTYSKLETIIPSLIDALRSHDNAGLRNSSMEALIKIGDKAVPWLTRHINDPDIDLRKFIVDILGEIGNEDSIDRLIDAIGDPDENVAIAAVEALGKIGSDRAITPLLKTLKEGDLTLKFSALEALSKIGKPVPMEYIEGMINNRLLRKGVFDLLQGIGDRSSIPYLIEGLKDISFINVEASLIAMRAIARRIPDVEMELRSLIRERIDDETIEKARKILTSSNNPEARKGAIFLFGLRGDVRYIPILLDTLKEEGLEEDVEKAIIQMGREATGYLIEGFKEREPRIKVLICSILGETMDTAGEDTLIEALSDDNGHVRSTAALALGRIGSNRAIDILIRLMEDEYEDVRGSARISLGMIGDRYKESTLERVQTILSSTSSSVLKKNLILLLGKLIEDVKEDSGYSTPILSALKDEDPEVRKAAINTLATLNIKDREEHIISALTDEDGGVRSAAVKTLGKIGYKEAIEPLTLCLHDNDLWVRCDAIESLGRIGGREVIEELKATIMENDEGIIIIKAIEALKELDPQGSYDLFINALTHRDNEVKKAALNALQASSMDERVQRRILPLLENEDWSIRNEAAKALSIPGAKVLLPFLKDYLSKETDPAVKKTLKEAIDCISEGIEK